MSLFCSVYAQTPTITKLLPSDNAQGVNVKSNLEITFDTPVEKGIGNLEIRRLVDDEIVEAIDVNSGNVTVLETVVTINPTTDLIVSTDYYIRIESGAFKSQTEISFDGITDNSSWNFTTGCSLSPTILSYTDLMDTSVELSWEGVTGVSGYQVSIRDNSTNEETSYSIDTDYISVSGLTPGTSYSWEVRSNCDDSYSNWALGTSFTTTECGVRPTGLNVSAVTENSVTLTWNHMEGVVDYQIWVSGIGTIYSTNSDNSYTISGLEPGTTYSWSIKSKCVRGGVSPLGHGTKFTTIGTNVCGLPPTNLQVSDVTSSSATFTWDEIEGVNDYQIWISGIGTIYSTNNSNSFTYHGLPSGTTFSWSAKAICSGSVSSLAHGSVFTTTECGMPLHNLSVSDITDNSAVLSWNDMIGVDAYELWIDGMGSIDDAITVFGNSYTLNNLDPGSTVNWQVRSICNGTDGTVFSSFSSGEFTTSQCGVKPTMLAVENVLTNAVTLTWDEMQGVSDYQIWISGIGTIYSTNGNNSYTINELEPGTTYSWNVRSICARGGVSPLAHGTEFTTNGPNACEVRPTTLNVTAITSTSATFTWDNMGADDYQIWISGIGTIYTTNGVNQYIATTLVPGTTYSWGVKSRCSGYGVSSIGWGDDFITADTEALARTSASGRFSKKAGLELSTEEDNNPTNILTLYPNPTVDEVIISLSGDQTVTAILVYNSQGVLMKNIVGINSRLETVKLREYGSGIYLIKVVINNEYAEVRKVLVN